MSAGWGDLRRAGRDWVSGGPSGPIRLALQCVLGLALAVAFWRYSMAIHEDFRAYWAAGNALIHGDRLYGDAILWADARAWISELSARPTAYGPYIYPPPLGMLWMPLVMLPASVASLVWFSVAFLAVLLTAFVLVRLLLDGDSLAFLLVSVLLIYFQPIRRNLSLEQVDTVTLALLALGLAAYVGRRDTLAGLAIAGAIVVKPFLAFVLLFFLWKRSYRVIGVAALASGLLIGASFAALGLDTLRDYLVATSYWASPQFAATFINQSPNGMLIRAFTTLDGHARIADLPWLVLPLRLVVSALTIGVLAYAISRDRRLPPATVAAEYGLTLIAMVFVSPLGEDLHYVYAVIGLLAAAVLTYQAWLQRAPMRWLGVGVVALYLVFLYPMHLLFDWDGPFYALCLTALVVTAVVLTDARWRRQAQPRDREERAAQPIDPGTEGLSRQVVQTAR